MRYVIVTLLSLSLLASAPHVEAAESVDDNTRNAARNLAEQGREAFDKSDFERSRDLFHRAYELVQAPTLALYEARALTKLGRLVEAEEAYLRAIRTPLRADSPDAFRKAVRDAEAEELLLEPRVPKLIVVLSGPGAKAPELSVTLDHARVKSALLGVEMPVDPGSHELEASVPGAEASRVPFTIAERERKTVELRVSAPVSAPVAAKPTQGPRTELRSPPEPSRSSWQRPTGFAVGALGIVGLGTGIITGLMSTSHHGKAEEQCPNQACVAGSAGEDELSSFRTLRTVSTVGYVVGAVGVAAGVTLLLTAPAERPGRASVGLWLNPGSAGVRGAF